MLRTQRKLRRDERVPDTRHGGGNSKTGRGRRGSGTPGGLGGACLLPGKKDKKRKKKRGENRESNVKNSVDWRGRLQNAACTIRKKRGRWGGGNHWTPRKELFPIKGVRDLPTINKGGKGKDSELHQHASRQRLTSERGKKRNEKKTHRQKRKETRGGQKKKGTGNERADTHLKFNHLRKKKTEKKGRAGEKKSEEKKMPLCQSQAGWPAQKGITGGGGKKIVDPRTPLSLIGYQRKRRKKKR